MKCDVCLTKIPLGETKCPNCGYSMKKVYASSYDTDSKTHEHINTNKKNLKFRIKDDHPVMKQHKTIINGKKNNPMVSQLVILIIGVIFILGSIFLAVLDINYSDKTETSYDNLTLQEIIDNGNGTESIEAANSYESDFKAYLENNNFSDITVNEYVSTYDDSYVTLNFYTNRNNISYTFDIMFTDSSLYEVGITISGKYDKDIDIKEFNLKEDEIKDITEYLEMDNMYSILKTNHSLMNKEDDGRYLYSSYNSDNYDLYMSEEYKNSSTPYYYFYYSYSINK